MNARTNAALIGISLAAMAQALVTGCESRAPVMTGDLARYHLSSAPDSRVTLPAELREVSGLAVAPGGRLLLSSEGGEGEAAIATYRP